MQVAGGHSGFCPPRDWPDASLYKCFVWNFYPRQDKTKQLRVKTVVAVCFLLKSPVPRSELTTFQAVAQCRNHWPRTALLRRDTRPLELIQNVAEQLAFFLPKFSSIIPSPRSVRTLQLTPDLKHKSWQTDPTPTYPKALITPRSVQPSPRASRPIVSQCTSQQESSPNELRPNVFTAESPRRLEHLKIYWFICFLFFCLWASIWTRMRMFLIETTKHLCKSIWIRMSAKC